MASSRSSDLDQIRAALEVVEAGLAPRPNVLRDCFPEALALIRDRAPMKFGFTTRRGAKSYSAFLEIVDDALDNPRANFLVIGLSRLAVRRTFWNDVAKRVDREFDLKCSFNETELRMELPNGATIYFLGLDAAPDEGRKVLGGKFRKILIDEAQDFSTDLEELIFKTLIPTLIDEAGRGSSICLTGTPGNRVNGYFARVTKGCYAGHLSPPLAREPGWSGHTWTTEANPYTAKEFRDTVARLVADNPLVRETSWFQQMYLGRWVVDLSDRVYKYDAALNTCLALPTFTGGRWHYAMGLDLGYSPDPNAFVIGAWHDFDPTLYLVESFKAWEMDITATAEKVRDFEKRYDLEAVVVDGANKVAIVEMNNRHGLSLLPAKKQAKEDAIRLMNDSFVMGRIKLLPSCNQGVPRPYREGQRGVKLGGSLALADEYLNLTWYEKMLGPPYFKHVEHPGAENHGADAALYLWRFAYEYVAAKPAPGPEVGTDGWYSAEEERIWDAEIEIVRERMPNPEPLASPEDNDPFFDVNHPLWSR